MNLITQITRQFDRRTIAIPAEIKERNQLQYDRWDCSEIIACKLENGLASLYYPSYKNSFQRGGLWEVPMHLFSAEDQPIVESLAKERPVR